MESGITNWKVQRVGNARIYPENDQARIELELNRGRKRSIEVSFAQLDFLAQTFIALTDAAVREAEKRGKGHLLDNDNRLKTSALAASRAYAQADGSVGLDMRTEDGKAIFASLSEEQARSLLDQLSRSLSDSGARSGPAN